MNNYIKGEHPAKWVREKLHELGVNEVNIPTFIGNNFIYCVVDDDCEYICSEAVKATIIASPDWKEVKPTEPKPKFRIGDIVQYHSGFFQVTAVRWNGGFTYCIGNDWYCLEDSLTRPNPAVRHKVEEAFSILNSQ